MFFHKQLFLLLIVLSPFGKSIFAQAYTKLEKKIIRSIYKDSGIDVAKVPNLLVLYAYEGQEGQINLDFHPDDTITLNPDYLVALGDVSQFLAAQSVLELVHKKKLQLSDDINQFLPQGHKNPTPIPLESLLNHQSGLPKIPTNFGQFEKDKNDPYRYYSDTALLTFVGDYPLAQKRGKYRYSLVNYALIQYILKHFGRKLPIKKGKQNMGHKEGSFFSPKSYYQFTAAKGLTMTPNELYQTIKATKEKTKNYPIFSTKMQKNIYSSYGFHILKSRKHEVALLKGAVNGFTVVAAFDRKRDRILVVVADSQDYTGRLYHALSWFF